jgi:arylformamidase
LSDWIDISTPLRSGITVWPGDPAPRVEQRMFLEKGDPFNLTHLDMSVHTGTHMDAPRHFIASGAGMDALHFDAVVGPARVIECRDPVAVQPAELGALERGERILLKTRNSARLATAAGFLRDFVYISREAARRIAAAGVRAIGIDYLSVGGFEVDAAETHLELLGAGVWIIEGLDLSRVHPGKHELICLPLSIPGSDGAPARAILRPL